MAPLHFFFLRRYAADAMIHTPARATLPLPLRHAAAAAELRHADFHCC